MKIKLIETPEQLGSFLTEFNSAKICLDFETTGLQAGIAKPRLIQICNADPAEQDRTVYVIDLFKSPCTSELKEFIESREMLIGHNLNFDLQFLLYLGIDFKNKIFCTYIAERILRAGFKEAKISPQAQKQYFEDVSCSLKACLERRFEIEIDKQQQVSDWSKEELDPEQIEYAARDVDILPRLAAEQLSEMREENLLPIYSIESKCIRPVARMCSRGFGVDKAKLLELEIEIQKKLEVKTAEFINSLDARLPDQAKLPAARPACRQYLQ